MSISCKFIKILFATKVSNLRSSTSTNCARDTMPLTLPSRIKLCSVLLPKKLERNLYERDHSMYNLNQKLLSKGLANVRWK